MSLVRLATRSLPTSARQASLPAPIGGWNARDGLDAMAPTDAIMLDNWFPGTASVKKRAGFVEHAHSLFGTVETVASFDSGANQKLLAASSGAIYDVTTASAAATSLASGFSVNRWQTVNFNATMGWVNGTDAPQVYDGSTVAAMTVSGSGLTVADLIGVAAFANRTYFWTDDSQDFWYSAVNALGGVLTKFPLSRVGQFGGKLVNIVPWTVGGASTPAESGLSVQQLLAFVMSSGDIVVYRGSDPGDATDWALVGVYRAGAPIDTRGAIQLAGDAIILTRDGAVPMSAVMTQGRFDPRNAITDKIRTAFVDAARQYGATLGWQAIFYPGGPWYLVNVPITTTLSHQYVMNTVTGAWCRFIGMNARSWAIHNDQPYFGGTNGIVYRADTGVFDSSNTPWNEISTPWEQWDTVWQDAGAVVVDITAEARQAFSAFGSPRAKTVTAIRPVVLGDGDLSVGISVEADFRNQGVPANQTPLAAQFQSWDAIATNWEAWDETWGSGLGEAIAPWLARGARGVKLNVRVAAAGQQDIEWFSTDFRYSEGLGL